MAQPRLLRHRHLAAAFAAALLLVACGGGGGAPAGSASCEVAAQNTWLRSYMRDWYFWSGTAPDPDPTPYAAVADYFEALRFPGDAAWPKDRWSVISDSASYNLYYGEGQTLGYGVFINGIEYTLPLRLRHVEPKSPAADAGLARGDLILSINGHTAADLVASRDSYAMLSPAKAGDTLTLVIDRNGVQTTFTLTAAEYTLTPVPASGVLTLANGSKAGYVLFKDFISQAEPALDAAFAQFRAAGAADLIIDLRHNGGGRISVASHFATQVVGAARQQADVFARLVYNTRHQASNVTYLFGAGPGPAFQRAVVIAGRRTCSASELLVNGLKPYMQVTVVGEATCGKPFGFNPVDSCGSTFSAVNFEAVNSLGEGRYFDGMAATCAVADDFTGVQGQPTERLTAAAVTWLETGACPAGGAADRQPLAARRERARGPEPGDRQGMIAD
jgi:hypothetical protein